MTCRNCGAELDSDAKFCPMCGTAQIQSNPEPESSQSFEKEPQPDPVFVETSPGNKGMDANAANVPKGTNGMAIAGFILAFFFPLLGLIFSAIGMYQCKQREEGGNGLAIAGLVLSIIAIAVWIILASSAACIGCSGLYYYM